MRVSQEAAGKPNRYDSSITIRTGLPIYNGSPVELTDRIVTIISNQLLTENSKNYRLEENLCLKMLRRGQLDLSVLYRELLIGAKQSVTGFEKSPQSRSPKLK